MNNELTNCTIQAALNSGVREFCICAGKRNATLVYALANNKKLKVYYWPEERSAAFFALGRIRASGKPVAVVTTSGSAVANLLPAAMEAHYTHLPLLLMTADRPRRLRGTGAPQSVEQVGIFSYYVAFMQDMALLEDCHLHKWTKKGPAHLNICFEEPEEDECLQIHNEHLKYSSFLAPEQSSSYFDPTELQNFLSTVKYPLVIVGGLPATAREKVIKFLLDFKAPVYTEAPSGIREDPRLAHWRVTIDHAWKNAAQMNYPIDGVIRIGSIPTARIWRDLDEKLGKVKVYSVCDLPFSGLSWMTYNCTPLDTFLNQINSLSFNHHACELWLQKEKRIEQTLTEIYLTEPQAEQSQVHFLSKLISPSSLVYLGNSLPVREWDQAATWEPKYLDVNVSRGVCGIDGQIATFLGLCQPQQENWAIIGDLTALYDLVAPWILTQLPEINANVVVINNGGGQIFSKMFSHPAFINQHQLQFGPLADFWKWHYEKWYKVPSHLNQKEGGRLIEVIPDEKATRRVSQRIKNS